jgi:glycosyltransferase involved in cell wall biosynthesis
MRIAQIAPIIERVPPKKYGGTERVIHSLTEQLVKRGHQVTLFATGDSQTSASLSSVSPRALREIKVDNKYGTNEWALLNLGAAYARQDEFDIIHDHNNLISLPTANISRTPVVMTIHGAFDENNKNLYTKSNNVNLVTISQAQMELAPEGANIVANIHHGLNMKDYPFSNTTGGYLLFVGRISREKGVHYAIKAAQQLKMPLIIAAKLETSFMHDLEYFYEHVEPYLSDNIVWIGEVNQDQRNRLMSQALCSLHPVTWPEPFGLTIIEAMACGTPVIAFNKGSIPEIIPDGEVGYVVDNLTEMCEAIKKIKKIDRRGCRRYALKNFGADRMAQEYEEIYSKLLAQKVQPKRPSYLTQYTYAHQISLKKELEKD